MRMLLTLVICYFLTSCQETVNFNLGKEGAHRQASEVVGSWAISHDCPQCSMDVGVIRGNAHLQDDNKVLFFGGDARYLEGSGFNISKQNMASYLLDTQTKRFTKVGDLNYERKNGSVTLLENGRALVALGVDEEGNYLLSAEIYEPATQSWHEVPPPTIPRQSHGAITLNNGKILFLGGHNQTGWLSSGEVFDPVNLTWEPFPYNLEYPRSNFSGVQSGDGRIVVIGGTIIAPYSPTSHYLVEVFDPFTQNFTAYTAPEYLDFRSTPIRISYSETHQKIFIFTQTNAGVLDMNDYSVNLVPQTGTIIDSIYSSHLKLDEERVLITGERLDAHGAEFGDSAYVYHFSSNTFEPFPSLIFGAAFQALVQMPNGDIVTIGGSKKRFIHFHKGAEIYSLADNRWSSLYVTTESVGEERSVVMSDDRILVTGGVILSEVLDRTYIYDPTSRKWQTTAKMNFARLRHSLLKISPTKYLVAGGLGNSGLNYLFWDSAEIYDATTETWSTVASMSAYRDSFSMTMLDSNRVLAVGGVDFQTNTALDIVETYIISEDRWEVMPPLNYARAMPRLFKLSNGKIICIGGVNSGETFLPAEIYNEEEGRWEIVANSHNQNAHLGYVSTLTPIGNDEFVVIGGMRIAEVEGDLVMDTEFALQIYNARTNTWRVMNSKLATNRMFHSATLLKDGRILIVGGVEDMMNLSDAEAQLNETLIYNPRTDILTSVEGTSPLKGVVFRHIHTLSNGQAVAIGGYVPGVADPISRVDIYRP